MLRDVFYYGKKPNVHPREKFATDLSDARSQSTTEHFWIINEHCDYRGFDWDFDFEYLPDEDVWAEEHINVWPSTHQKDSGTWLVNTDNTSSLTIYRADVDNLKRKNEKSEHWVELDLIDNTKFDFSWHPDPSDPPYIYKWGSKFAPVQFKTCLEYRVPGATQIKYMDQIVELLSNDECWVEVQPIDKDKFDMTWRPDPMDHPMIYVWGNKHIDGTLRSTLEYHVPGATERKYMPDLLSVLPEWDKWVEIQPVDKKSFDFSWRPDPREPAYIYVWGNKHIEAELKPTLEYHCDGATERKYMTNDVGVLPEWDRWVEVQPVDKSTFDFSWRPDPREPAYIYTWGNKYISAELKPTLEYKMSGATERKYMTNDIIVLPEWDKWVEVQAVDKSTFDFSWRPDPREPAYIYTWGNKFVDAELKSTLEYHCEGATERKYMTNDVGVLPEQNRWKILHEVNKKSFDFSWRPDPREPDLIYVFGNDQHVGNIMPTIEYHMPDAIERKYLDVQKAKLAPQPKLFEHLETSDGIDYSWTPDPTSPPYIYAWGNQWNQPQDKISIQYVVEGAVAYKYMEERATRKPCKDNWVIPKNVDVSNFDFSWEPSPKDPPFIYKFGTQWQKTGGPSYVVQGATQIKYVEFQKAKAITIPTDNWYVPDNVDVTGFDFSWHPDELDPPYTYYFSTQWALTGGPVYTVPGATEKKYIEFPVAVALSSKTNWEIPDNIDVTGFDFSWHPYADDDPFIYEFGTQWQKNGGPRYVTPGVDKNTPIKYIDTRILKSKRLSDQSNFHVLHDYEVDTKTFDFSWHPDNTEEPYIYVFGNQYYPAEKMPTMEYRVEGATQYKYINTAKVNLKPSRNNWKIIFPIDESKFDFSWVPDPGEPPYIYVWGNEYVSGELQSTLEYHVPGATDKKYMGDVAVTPEWDKYKILIPVDKTTFNFNWRPDPREPAFIYVWGNQWNPAEIESTVEYHVPGATEKKYMTDAIATVIPQRDKWTVLDKIYEDKFDFSWRPDPTEPPYIYVFGNNLYPAEIMSSVEYAIPGATQFKYMSNMVAQLAPDRTNWIIPNNVDITNFDFSWKPNPKDPSYVYHFGTQWQKTGGPKYIVPGAKENKYVDIKVKALPKMAFWNVPAYIDVSDFDFSWHPDETEEPYIYIFPTQWALSGGPVYTVPDATEKKYVEFPVAKSLPNHDNWEVPKNIDASTFDFSWHPYADDDPFIYEFGTQWQKNGGPRYVTPGVDPKSSIKYIDTRILKSKRLPDQTNFHILHDYVVDTKSFDFSWHPDNTEEPYNYVFGNQYYSAEKMPTMEYRVEGATQYKYVNSQVIHLKANKKNWKINIPINESKWDFSWVPDPGAPPYIYVWGNQWNTAELESTVEYHVHGATEIKYMHDAIATVLPDSNRWDILYPVDMDSFDFSWRPNPKDPAYIYSFGNNQYPANVMSTIELRIPGADDYKYIDTQVAKLAQDRTNWIVPNNVDASGFDFSWKPNPKDPLFIYEFGTQWQKTGGPRYFTPGATEIKYVDTQKVRRLTSRTYWEIPEGLDINEFDFSWHPDATEDDYIYQFGTQWALTGGPRYVTPDAKEIKYIDSPIAKASPNRKNWIIPNNIDVDSFDFSWHPYVEDQPYVYIFGTQHQKTGGPKYVAPGADNTAFTKYIDTRILKAQALPTKAHWETVGDIRVSSFDYSWHPDETEQPYIYVFGNNLYQAEDMPTIRYVVKGATQVKYVHSVVAQLAPDMNNWVIPNNVDSSNFDFSWRPNPTDPPYIYVWGNQWYPGTVMPTVRYVVPGATEIKHIDDTVAILAPDSSRFEILEKIDDFDFSWVPDPTSPPYIYVFGNQWNNAELEPTIQYKMPGATQIKYIHDLVAKAAPYTEGWETIEDVESFDYSWRPNPTEPAYTYIFGNTQYPGNIMPTVKLVRGGTQEKFVDVIVAKLSPKPKNFTNTKLISNFDYSWTPNPKDPAYIYQFGTQWAKTHGPTYVVKGATEVKYIETPVATIAVDMSNWIIPDGVDVRRFDFSWHPDATAPKYIYQFGTIENDTDGPKYIVPGATEVVHKVRVERDDIEIAEEVIVTSYPKYYITTTLEDLINERPTEIFWALRESINYDSFDFDWKPSIDQIRYVSAFGSPDSELTQTYFVNSNMWFNGHRGINFIENVELDEEYLAQLFKPSDMFFVDKGNEESKVRFEQLKQQFPTIQKTRYLNSWVDTINRCINRSSTELCWILNSELDYEGFDFNYYPNPWQMKMVHVFGTQWSHWGTTFMVNRDTFAADTKYIKIIEHLSNLNFVKDRKAVSTNVLHDIVYINHGNMLDTTGKFVIDYEESYLNTFKKLLDKLPEKKEHYVWICSSVCDYNGFDFTYICDPFAREHLHVFPSDKLKFGDTFFVNVNKLRELIGTMSIMEEYGKINYNQHQRATRLPAPVIVTEHDTHIASVLTDFAFPYAVFVTEDNKDIKAVEDEPMNLWSEDSKNIMVTSTGGTRVVVPKEAKDFVETQLYDYPYIKKMSKLAKSNPMDIVFLSNGESCADENYEHLLSLTKDLDNRVVRVDGVNGRVQAYHAAAEASNTPWMFTVFAKLKVNPRFDFNWQPDRLQMPKHYVFHAKNPINGLVYGHQAMIAYNKILTLNNRGHGLDFTMDDLHEVVSILSGTANFNTDAYSTWRTSFRESLKLRADTTEISKQRLEKWLTEGTGDFAEYSLKGALDAVDYYEEVNGDHSKLRLSYEWEWLRDFYERKYK